MEKLFQMAKLIFARKIGKLEEEEERQLQDWLSENPNKLGWYKNASDDYKIIQEFELYKKINSEKSWNKIISQIPELNKKSPFQWKIFVKWAAVWLLPFALTLYIISNYQDTDENVQTAKNNVSLILEDGKEIDLISQQEKVIRSKKGELATNSNHQLIYKKGEQESSTLTYNTIITPVKGEYFLELSDGTKVWLNAQTKLKFPVKFGPNKREVDLIGEACFEVKKDKIKKFIVNIDEGSKIEVLGTTFNVMAYADEQEIQATLVEGKIQFSHSNSSVNIIPGEQSRYNKLSKQVKVHHVNVSDYLAWKEGKFVFSREPLNSVFRKISRWYGVHIECKDSLLLNRRVSAKIDKYEEIEKLIELLEEVSPVKFQWKEGNLLATERRKEHKQ